MTLLLAFVCLLVIRAPQVATLQTALGVVFAPAQGLVGGPLDRVGHVLEDFSRIGQLQAENAALRTEIDQVRREAASVPDLEREIATLREQLELDRSQPDFQWIEARVVGVDPSNLSQSVAIDRGSADGVLEGMTVMTARGLVGRVARVTPRWSNVLLITDVASSVNVVVQSGRTRGIVGGQRRVDGHGLVMRHIVQGEPIGSGDAVVTSGLGGVFPAGIPVGTVTDVRQRDTDLFQEATIEPAVDFAALETVLVVVNHVPLDLE